MESIIPIIIQIVSGVVGGNIAGAVKSFSLGPTGNSVAGGLGGLLLGQGMSLLSNPGIGGAASSLISSVIGSGAAGLVVTAVIGFIRNHLGKKS